MIDLWIALELLLKRHKDLKDPVTGQYGQDEIIGEALDYLEDWWKDHGDKLIERTGEEMIMTFTSKHKIGSICKFPCVQCGETINSPGTISDNNNDMLSSEGPPVLIIREATQKEWLQWCKENTGDLIPGKGYAYFYEVQTD